MTSYIPVLLSFYALSNGKEALIFGQLTNTSLNDLSFTDYGRRKTFRTLLSLYRTRPIVNQSITIRFDNITVAAKTDAYGSFFVKSDLERADGVLQEVMLSTGEVVLIMNGLYLKTIHHVITPYIVVSDIDDTLLHSHISNKLRQVGTLMFTPVEKRRAVEPMQEVMKSFTTAGAAAIYLSNSEQNLYPLIYRFLLHNDFPTGPLFLRRMRKFWDILRYRKLSEANVHKIKMLDHILGLFPDKKFALVGDNTQHDLSIYLEVADRFPELVRFILIRKVVKRSSADKAAAEAREKLSTQNTDLYYSDTFPHAFDW